MSNTDDLLTSINDVITPLLTGHGFKGPFEKILAYEYHYYFVRKNMAVHYLCETGNDLPKMSILFFKENVDENITARPENYFDYTDLEPGSEVLKIYDKSSKRIGPAIKSFVENLESPEAAALREKLEEDYRVNGRKELNDIVGITGEFLRKNIDMLKNEDTGRILREFRKRSLKNKLRKLFSIK